MSNEGIDIPLSKEAKLERVRELEETIEILNKRVESGERDWSNPYALDNELLQHTVELENLQHELGISHRRKAA